LAVESATTGLTACSVIPGRLEEANRNLENPGSMLRIAPE